MAEITVIVPVYNTETYLTRCVRSVLSQTFSDLELILINDGSTDKSAQLCDAFAVQDPRVRVIHQKNSGQAAAKNAGIDRAFAEGSSRWITFVDSDDWIHPEYLERLRRAAIEHNSRVSACGLIKTDGTSPAPEPTGFSVETLPPEDLWIKNRLISTIPVCKLCEKALFEGYRFPVGRIHEDEFLLYRVLFSCDTVAYVKEDLYYYYQNPAGISLQKKWTPERADSLEAFSAQCSFFHAHGFFQAENLSAKALFVGCSEVLHNLLSLYPDEKKMIRACRALLKRTRRKYRSVVSLSDVGGKKSYERLAHPRITHMKKKGKHAVLFMRKIFHA